MQVCHRSDAQIKDAETPRGNREFEASLGYMLRSSFRISVRGTGSMAQWVRYLLYEHGNLTADPEHPPKKPGIEANTWNPRAGDKWMHGAPWAAGLARYMIHRRSCLKK